MKRKLYILVAAIALGSFFSCEPTEDRESLPGITLTPETLKFSVVQNPQKNNEVKLNNLDSSVIPYWAYSDASGEIGHYNTNEQIVFFPFAGNYIINFTGYTRGGAVYANPVNVKVNENDASFFSDPKWDMLTNGETGKTWVLDMTHPVGWAGLDYPAASGDNWNWFPDYADNSWVMENKDWGHMTLDLNGAYNDSVTQTALSGTSQTTKKGTFIFDIANNKLTLNGGVEILYGGDYHPDVSNWSSVHVIKLTETELELGVVRDQSRTGEGKCQIVFRYKPKP
jgi:hypothetical protein